jgi:hypothetical protein
MAIRTLIIHFCLVEVEQSVPLKMVSSPVRQLHRALIPYGRTWRPPWIPFASSCPSRREDEAGKMC